MGKNYAKKLAAYSVMALPVILSAEKANAQIIYHDVDPDKVFTGVAGDGIIDPSFTAHIDFDGDGTDEFIITAIMDDGCTGFITTCQEIGNVMATMASNVQIIENKIAKTAIWYGYSYYWADVLDLGEPVSAGRQWNALWTNVEAIHDSFVYYPIWYPGSSIFQPLQEAGNWKNETDKYLGVRFLKSGHYYYGWVRLTTIYNPDTSGVRPELNYSLTLKDYAYNAVPDEQILAGEGEPGCVAPIPEGTVSISPTSTKLKWSDVPDVAGYQVYYRETGTGTWNKIKADGHQKTLIGLSCNTNYEWKVRSGCDPSDYSDFSAIQTFTTAVCRIGDTENPNEIIAYPDPATDKLFIDIGALNTDQLKLEISDMAGKKISEIVATDDEVQQINIEGLANGVYILHVSNGETSRAVQFVKQ